MHLRNYFILMKNLTENLKKKLFSIKLLFFEIISWATAFYIV